MKTAKINGKTRPAPSGALAWKYNDPTEKARWVYDQDDYDNIYREDPSLLVPAENKRMTIAQRIAEQFNNDGQCFEADDGEEINEACDLESCSSKIKPGTTDIVRYTFPDDSAITIRGNAWDLGYIDCYCWQTTGHRDDCAGRQGQTPPDNLPDDIAEAWIPGTKTWKGTPPTDAQGLAIEHNAPTLAHFPNGRGAICWNANSLWGDWHDDILTLDADGSNLVRYDIAGLPARDDD